MQKNDLPQVFVSTKETTRFVSGAVKAGKVRRIGPRLYTTDMTSSLEEVIQRNLWVVIGLLFPGAVVAHRTALEARPSQDGTVFLSGPYNRTLRLPGLTIKMIKGPGPLEGDAPFVQSLFIASRPRSILENLTPSRDRDSASRAAGKYEVESLLERTLSISGDKELNDIRDKARALAEPMNAQAAFKSLDDITGTLLGTRSAHLSSPAAIARIAGKPYDSNRLPLFDALVRELNNQIRPAREDKYTDESSKRNLAFIDSYFSNYIEGTEFEIDEAIEIIFSNKIPATRPADAHDIIGTYQILIDEKEVVFSSSLHKSTFSNFIDTLQRRHARLMSGRPETKPGTFKTEPNRAGRTSFVSPELVIGTLEKGFTYFTALPTPFARAVFLMFLVAEVHPFMDGNGRLARLMMNMELISNGNTRILIPTVYRDSYIQALRNLSREIYALTLAETMDFAQRFTASLFPGDLGYLMKQLESANAFLSPDEGKLRVLQ